MALISSGYFTLSGLDASRALDDWEIDNLKSGQIYDLIVPFSVPNTAATGSIESEAGSAATGLIGKLWTLEKAAEHAADSIQDPGGPNTNAGLRGLIPSLRDATGYAAVKILSLVSGKTPKKGQQTEAFAALLYEIATDEKPEESWRGPIDKAVDRWSAEQIG